MAIDPDTIIPEEVEQSYDNIQQIKDYIPTTSDTSAQVRDKVRKLAAFLYKYLEVEFPPLPDERR
jgi:hypothetical protein